LVLLFVVFFHHYIQQNIAMSMHKSSILFLKWINFTFSLNNLNNYCTFKDSKFFIFSDYFNAILNEELSLIVMVHVNGEENFRFSPKLIDDKVAFKPSAPMAIHNACDENQPIECSSGGFTIHNGKFEAMVELTCQPLVLMNLQNSPTPPTEIQEYDSDIIELEYEANNRNKRFQSGPDPMSIVDTKIHLSELEQNAKNHIHLLQELKKFII